jgi:hypothetical protein
MIKRSLMSWLLSTPLLRKSGGKTNPVSYVKKALAKSQLVFKPKSPRLLSQDWFLYRDNTTVHTAASVQDFKWWWRGMALQVFSRRGPSRFFFHQRVKSELAGILLSRDSFKTICDVVIQTIAKVKFVDAFQQWMDCCGKCGWIGGEWA